MPENIYITASCTISNHVVRKDGHPVFEDRETDLPGFLVAAYRHFGWDYPKFYKMDNLSKLGWLAAEIVLKDSFITGAYEPGDIGVVLTNASASLDTDIKYYETVKSMPSPAVFVYTLPNIVIGEICIRHHFKGENAFFISDAFDAGFMERYVSGLITNNIVQACLCGWVELLDKQYKTVLFLAEKGGTGRDTLFTKENLNKIYQSENG